MNKKALIAALLGLAGTAAYAQTNVQIYGTVDTGYVKETGTDIRMDENEDNVIGFKGTEDLGGGYKATFQLEKQFQLYDGGYKDSEAFHDALAARLKGEQHIDWLGAANAGIKGDFGHIRLGRVNEMSVEYFKEIDPFEQLSTGSGLSKYNLTRSEQISNTLRYDSPEWSGFSFGATYTLGTDTHQRVENEDGSFSHKRGVRNDGFGASLRYDNDDLFLTANFTRVADSCKSWVWNVGGAYSIGDFRVSLGYQKSQVKDLSDWRLGEEDDFVESTGINQQEWEIGLAYGFGASTVKFAYNRALMDGNDYLKGGNANKYALGYTYDLSKRTQLYGMVSYTDSSNDDVGSIYNNNGVASDSVTGIQVGIMHNF
ncbi:MAG: porin [Oxalobacter sp.]|nr:porin [Oxalobacter sp.]